MPQRENAMPCGEVAASQGEVAFSCWTCLITHREVVMPQRDGAFSSWTCFIPCREVAMPHGEVALSCCTRYIPRGEVSMPHRTCVIPHRAWRLHQGAWSLPHGACVLRCAMGHDPWEDRGRAEGIPCSLTFLYPNVKPKLTGQPRQLQRRSRNAQAHADRDVGPGRRRGRPVHPASCNGRQLRHLLLDGCVRLHLLFPPVLRQDLRRPRLRTAAALRRQLKRTRLSGCPLAKGTRKDVSAGSHSTVF